MIQITGTNLKRTSNINVKIDHYPSKCPICHISISPIFIAAVEILPDVGEAQNKARMNVVFQCTEATCKRLFIATYSGFYNQILQLGKTEPLTPIKHSFPPEIKSTSTTFVEIFNQVAAAEALNLEQLVGIGLRKALEFLIKDYAISQKPEKKVNIEKEFLSNCINDYIDDPQVKQCAKFAAWLGNDEAHYIRKWEDKDITDLKRLITLTVNWIQNTILTKKYVEDMGGPIPKKPDKTTKTQ
jgi:hypothetical protein